MIKMTDNRRLRVTDLRGNRIELSVENEGIRVKYLDLDTLDSFNITDISRVFVSSGKLVILDAEENEYDYIVEMSLDDLLALQDQSSAEERKEYMSNKTAEYAAYLSEETASNSI